MRHFRIVPIGESLLMTGNKRMMWKVEDDGASTSLSGRSCCSLLIMALCRRLVTNVRHAWNDNCREFFGSRKACKAFCSARKRNIDDRFVDKRHARSQVRDRKHSPFTSPRIRAGMLHLWNLEAPSINNIARLESAFRVYMARSEY